MTAPLGPAFARLWTAAMASNLADGIARLAIPLTAVTLTTDPVAISVLAALAYVPWLIFGVPAGMIVDRFDRRYVMAIANVARVIAAAGVALAIATGAISLPLLAVATVVFGIGETLFDNATNAVMPSLVKRKQLDRANGRIQAAQVGVDMFVAQPISGVLFSLAVMLPMLVGGAGYLIAIALVVMLPVRAARARHVDADGMDRDPVPLKDALGFLWHHRYLRNMTIVTTAIGTALAFAQAVTVLLFVDYFGVTAELVGLVTAGIGVGGLLGALTAGKVVARIGRGRSMLAASVLGGVGLLAVGIVQQAWVAVAVYALSAYGISLWNVAWAALRQMIIPEHLLGRVLGAARTIAWSLMPVASLAGGWVARVELQLPYIVGGAVAIAVSLLAARLLLSADRYMPDDSDEDDDAADAVAPERPAPTAPVLPSADAAELADAARAVETSHAVRASMR